MPRVPIPNFHHARLSIAQSCLREFIGMRAPQAPPSGLFPNHPILQAASAVLARVHQAEVQDAQIALSAYDARRQEQSAQGMLVAAPLETPRDCLDIGARYIIAWAMDDKDTMARLSSEWTDSPCDVDGWLSAIADWLDAYALGDPPKYNPPTADGPGHFDLPAPASGGALRVGVLGDWGTGESEAVAVLAQLMAQKPDVIIHVGDVYYAGTASEQQNHFLALIQSARAASGLAIPVYTLPGNHDYYSGGGPFYDMIPALNAGIPGASIQENSFWCLRNDAWQLQGMDTGYHDSDIFEVGQDTTHLRDDEAAWHQEKLAGAAGRQVILFSHHQLFSAFEQIGGAWSNPSLLANLQAWQAASPFSLAAWFWGHEHLLEVYQTPGSLPVLGRCVGNGAFPTFINTGAYQPNPAGAPMQPVASTPGGTPFPNGFVQTEPDDLVWACGFATLELENDGTGTAKYFQVTFDGDMSTATTQLLYQEPLPAASQQQGIGHPGAAIGAPQPPAAVR